MCKNGIKLVFTFLLATVLMVSSSFTVFASEQPVSELGLHEKDVINNGGILIKPDGEQLQGDNFKIDGENISEKNSVQAYSPVLRNCVYILKNTVTPIYYFADAPDDFYINANYDISESYLRTYSQWMNVTKAQQESTLTNLANNVSGSIYSGQWLVTVEFEVESANPVSITYNVDGVEKTDTINYAGTYTYQYLANSGQSAIWSGYLTFIQNGYGTASFNGGAILEAI